MSANPMVAIPVAAGHNRENIMKKETTNRRKFIKASTAAVAAGSVAFPTVTFGKPDSRKLKIGFIGCEPFINGVARLVRTVEISDIKNIRIHAADARQLIETLPDSSIERCFILFPDPWPKRRHHRRRIVSPDTLAELARVIVDGGRLRLASDHRGYVRWILFHTLQQGAFEWCARGPEDWRTRPSDWPPTRYEEKAAQRGETSIYLEFIRRARADK